MMSSCFRVAALFLLCSASASAQICYVAVPTTCMSHQSFCDRGFPACNGKVLDEYCGHWLDPVAPGGYSELTSGAPTGALTKTKGSVVCGTIHFCACKGPVPYWCTDIELSDLFVVDSWTVGGGACTLPGGGGGGNPGSGS